MRSGGNALYGRDLECARLDQLIADLRSHRGGSLMFAGETGVGKTALLGYASRRAEDLRVLTAHGVPAEASLHFAGLHQVLRPVLDLLPAIPARQAQALSAGLALSSTATFDPLAVAAGTCSILAAAGRDTRLLVLVDDLDLLDPPSRGALLFAARRSRSDGIGMLLTASVEDEQAGLPCHRLGPLDAAAGLELLRAKTEVPVDALVAEHIVRATSGMPLAIAEAAGVLTPDQLAGAEPLPAPFPVGEAVLRALAPRLAALDTRTRTALLVAAAAGDASLAQILAALVRFGLPAEVLSAAESEGLIVLAGDRVVIRHPLLGAVAYHEATVTQRRAVHQALAEVTRPARRAWHLGAAALAPDERTAEELEQIAHGRDRVPVNEAARLMERAAELTGTDQPRARRYAAAAELWQLAGAGDRARQLLNKAGQLTGDLRTRARVQTLLGSTEARCGQPVRAYQLLVRESVRVRSIDPATAAVMLLDAADACCLADEPKAALQAVHRAGMLARQAADPIPTVQAGVHALVLAGCGKLAEARSVLAGCRADLEPVVLDNDLPTGWRRTLRQRYPALLARLGELSSAELVLEEVIAQSRIREAAGLLPGLLVERAELGLRTGDWDGAQAAGAEAARLAGRAGQSADLAGALVSLARLNAVRGQGAECVNHLQRARDLAQSGRLDGFAVPIIAVEGLLALGNGDYEEAYAKLERLALRVEAGSMADHGRVAWVADFVEAAARVGQRDRARRLLNETVRHASGSLSLPTVLVRCRALFADDDAEPLFCRALRGRPGCVEPFELARTGLCLGEWLCEHGRPEAAGARLATALRVFDELGARPWAQRASGAVRSVVETGPAAERTGDRGAPENGASLNGLTAQEQRVTLLVGQGATNREAASALFLSPKTIEFHLRSVYRKLGLRSRAELAHLVGRIDPANGGRRPLGFADCREN